MENKKCPTPVDIAKYVTARFTVKENYFYAIMQMAAIQQDYMPSYIKQVKDDHDKIYSDAAEVLNVLNRKNYELYKSGRLDDIQEWKKVLKETGGTADSRFLYKCEIIKNDYVFSCQFLSLWLSFYLLTAQKVGADIERLKTAIKSKAAEWFTPPMDKDQTAEKAIKSGEEENKKNLQQTKQRYPNNYTILNDKVTDATFNNGFEDGVIQPVITGRKKGLQAIVSIDFKELREITDDPALQKLTEFDQAIYNAVTTLYISGNSIVTEATISKVVSGCPGNARRIRAERAAKIKKSVEKMSSIRLSIDVTREMEAYPGFDQAYVRGNLLYSKRVDAVINGKETTAFQILDTPLLYRYAHVKKQVISIPIKVLNTKISKTVSNILLQEYLLKKIGQARSGHLNNNTMTFKKLYEDLGITSRSSNGLKKRHYDTRKNVFALLNEWKQIDYIKDYNVLKEKAVITGVRFVL